MTKKAFPVNWRLFRTRNDCEPGAEGGRATKAQAARRGRVMTAGKEKPPGGTGG